MAFIYLYKNGSFWYAAEIEDEGTAVSAPSRMSPTSEYGSWSGWYDLTYNHIVKTPTSPTQTSSTTYHSYLPRRERTVTTTTYSNDWAAQLVRNGVTYSYTIASDTSWLVTFDGQYDINIYYTPKSSSQSTSYEYDYGSWRGDTYTLSAVSFDGYTQNNYSGTSSSYTASRAPGTSIWAPDLTKWDGPFPFESVTWTPSYSKKIFALTLDPSPGSGGPTTIYYWDTIGWFSDPDTAESHRITEIDIPSRPGYDFSGYGTIIDDEGNIVGTIDENTSLDAEWDVITYTATFEMGNGGSMSTTSVDYNIETEFVCPGPITVNDNCRFTGWKVISSSSGNWVNGTVYNDTTPETPYSWGVGKYGDVTLEAQWEFRVILIAGQDISSVRFQDEDVTEKWLPLNSTPTIIATVFGSTFTTVYTFNTWRVFYPDGTTSDISNSETYTIEPLTEPRRYMAIADEGVASHTIVIKNGLGVIKARLGSKSSDNKTSENVYGWDAETDTSHKQAQHTYEYEENVAVEVVRFVGSLLEPIGGGPFDPIPESESEQIVPWVGEDDDYRYTWGSEWDGKTGGWYNDTTNEFISPKKLYEFVVEFPLVLRAECNGFEKYQSSISNSSSAHGTIAFNDGDKLSPRNIRHKLPKDENNPWAKYDLDNETDIYKNDYTVFLEATPDPGYMISKWIITPTNGPVIEIIPDPDDENHLELPVMADDVVITAKFNPWQYIYHDDNGDHICHWNKFYVFVKTDDPNLPWKVVKEIHVKTSGSDDGWTESSRNN